MEFTITCPIDGPVTVSLEDIDTVVLREAERADITFVCPHCGTEITVSAVVPSFLMAAIEALAEEGDSTGPFAGMFEVASDTEDAVELVAPDDPGLAGTRHGHGYQGMAQIAVLTEGPAAEVAPQVEVRQLGPGGLRVVAGEQRQEHLRVARQSVHQRRNTRQGTLE